MDSCFRIVVGRFDPLHDGHINLINHCLEKSGDNTLIMVGSPNSHVTNWPKGWENKKPRFSFDQRVSLIQTAFPTGVKIVPIPDMFEADLWWCAFENIVKAVFPSILCVGRDSRLKIVVGEKAEVIYEQVYKKYLSPYQMEVVDRNIDNHSATKVREALANGKDISKYMSNKNVQLLTEQYYWGGSND